MNGITFTMLFFLLSMFVSGQETKTFEKDNINFQYPSDWIVRNLPGFYILVSEPPKEVVSIMTTFDVEIEEGAKNLKQYGKQYERTMSTNYKDFKIKSRKEVDFKGMKAIEYNCTAIVHSLPVEWKSVIFIKNGKIYKLSTTSLLGDFHLKKEITEKIFESFEIE